MKTPEEIKNGLLCHEGDAYGVDECEKCPHNDVCSWPFRDCVLAVQAYAYINQLEERIALMKVQMRGDCGCCAYKGRPSYESPCTECLCGENRPNWEYEGLPEVQPDDANI